MVGELWDLRAVVEGFSRPRTMPESLSFSVPSPTEDSMKKEEFVKPFCLLPPGEQSRHEEKKTFSPPPKSKKKRKAQQKKVVCELPADALADNVWAWRKYGQKPIKDSPYPRGYYRCSSCKGCPARKQVERSRTRAGFFLVTYTAEHNHAPPIQRQKSPPLSGLLKMSPGVAEQRTPPPPIEVERETTRNLCGDDVDGLSDEDFIFMDLDTLFEADVDGL